VFNVKGKFDVMEKAFVLINSELASAVARDLEKVEGVDEVQVTRGLYDLIALLRADSMEDLRALTRRIRAVNHVDDTLTVMLIENTDVG
jgi:DNA-binding Lrp family transcriptional regulator